jgi:hypothetical protein
MKKVLFSMLAIFALASCNDDCDHDVGGGGITGSNFLVGSWYEETQNEEDTYSASSAFYCKFCNTLVQGEGQGTYYLDTERNRLTQSYHVNGMYRTNDWKLRDVSKYQFVQYSDLGVVTYGKIVDTYNMTGGETKSISFNELNVQGYESTNEHIATVSSDGLVTATGEKGTVYIKIKCLEATVYVKVVVGDNYPDLWIDYSGLLGNDYVAMRNLLGDPDSSSENDGYSLYVYLTKFHSVLRGLRVSIDSDTHKIFQIDMLINEGVPLEKLLAYMNAHYYLFADDGKEYYYSTSSELEGSRAVYTLLTDKETTGVGSCAIMMMEGELFEEYTNTDIVPKYSRFFGLDEEQVIVSAAKRGWKYYDRFDTYSHNGSVAYTLLGYDYCNTIEFVYNSDNLVSQCVVYMSNNAPDRMLLKYLEDNFTEAENEKTLRKLVYYNSAKTMKAEFDILTKALYFTDLSQKLFDPVVLGTYWKGMGKSKQEVINLFGQPYSSGNVDEDTDYMAYVVIGDYIQHIDFYLSKSTGNVIQINMQLQDSVDDNEIISYLNKWYHFLENKNTEQGPRMRWLNAENPGNATLRTTYYPDYNLVVYGIPE